MPLISKEETIIIVLVVVSVVIVTTTVVMVLLRAAVGVTVTKCWMLAVIVNISSANLIRTRMRREVCTAVVLEGQLWRALRLRMGMIVAAASSLSSPQNSKSLL